MTITIEAVEGDNSKIKVTETKVNGGTTTTVKIYDKDTYLANQYQVKAQALNVKSSTIEVQDAIISSANANIAAVEAL